MKRSLYKFRQASGATDSIARRLKCGKPPFRNSENKVYRAIFCIFSTDFTTAQSLYNTFNISRVNLLVIF
jgi:hypothetical protein